MKSILLALLIIILILGVLSKGYSLVKDRLSFFINGLDAGFSIGEISLLWNVADVCKLKDPNSLFFSIQALTKCMVEINNKSAKEGTEKSTGNQNLMTKLFAFRTKIQNASDDKKGIDSTIALDKGQRLRLVLPGKGVFVSEIVNNGTQMTIAMPKQKDLIPVPAGEWQDKSVSVYLWRAGDAQYVFDTTVMGSGQFLGKLCLYLKHSSNLIRTQKRKSVRAKCDIKANLYIITGEKINYAAVETQAGYRCMLEDISESGALIKIGGKGEQGLRIKIQFTINNKLIMMFGVVRTVEFNEEIGQSKLHFECIHIDPLMKNEILSYVYNMMPEAEKEAYEAMKETADDAKSEDEKSEENSEGDENKSDELEKNVADEIAGSVAFTDEALPEKNPAGENNENSENVANNGNNGAESAQTENTTNAEVPAEKISETQENNSTIEV